MHFNYVTQISCKPYNMQIIVRRVSSFFGRKHSVLLLLSLDCMGRRFANSSCNNLKMTVHFGNYYKYLPYLKYIINFMFL